MSGSGSETDLGIPRALHLGEADVDLGLLLGQQILFDLDFQSVQSNERNVCYEESLPSP